MNALRSMIASRFAEYIIVRVLHFCYDALVLIYSLTISRHSH